MRKKYLNKAINSVGIALLLLLMVAGILTYIAPHLGWHIDGVRSGSMAPAIERGTLVIGKSVRPETIAVSDIIIFRPVGVGENLLVHRAISIEAKSPRLFQTKGDAETKPDPYPVPARNVMAKVLYSLPLLGYLAMFLKTPYGFVMSVVVPGLMIIAVCVYGIRRELTRMRRGPDR